MKEIAKHTGVGTALTLLGPDFYHVKAYGDPEYRSLYKNSDEKIYANASDLFVDSGKLFFNGYGENRCFVYEGSKLHILSESFILNGKTSNPFVSTTENPYRNEIRDEALRTLLPIGTRNLLFAQNNEYVLSNFYDLINNPELVSIVECCDKKGKLLWSYDFSTLGKASQSESTFQEAVKLRRFVGASDNLLVFATSNDWLVGLDAESGQERWVLRGIKEVYSYQQGTVPDRFNHPAMIKIDSVRNVLYCFDRNVYWEWDIKTCQLITLVHKYESARQEYFNHDGHPYIIVDEIIYYPYAGEATEFEGRRAWPKLMGVSRRDGTVMHELIFKKKRGEKEIYGWMDFQYSDGRFYLLDNWNVLRIIEH